MRMCYRARGFFSCCFSCTPMQIASHKSSMKCKNPMITLRIGEKEITNTTQQRRRRKESQPILVWFVSPENYNDADSKYKHNKLKSQLKKSWIMPKTHRLERRSREKKTRASTHTHTQRNVIQNKSQQPNGIPNCQLHWLGRVATMAFDTRWKWWWSVLACNKQFTLNLHWCYSTLKVSVYLGTCLHLDIYVFISAVFRYYFQTQFQWLSIRSLSYATFSQST